MNSKNYKLGDIAEIVNGATPSTLCEDNYDGNIVWITPKDLSEQKNKYIEKGNRNITEKDRVADSVFRTSNTYGDKQWNLKN